ncbi:cell division control protein 2 like protein 2 [Strigomonas culicis]|uniref:cyclin-dependent kinase n=1 Tax=Strigomonas culicis TaxID=28005 RepID=S9V4T4_9TRYP|nr:cell division control protein 2 like protein 2 [Strigomonas culicis]|eukprot:EPY21926.1 cell division control protein 2 like protein 2 [Strigomonas culicis]
MASAFPTTGIAATSVAKLPADRRHDSNYDDDEEQQQQQHLYNVACSGRGTLPTSSVERYERRGKIGQGSYGKVFQCRDRVTDRLVAIKEISWNCEDEGLPSSALREVALLKEVQHPNMVRLIDTIMEGKKFLLVFEYLDKDLNHLLASRKTPLVGSKLKTIMFQLLTGLHACHSRRIVHRDIKPQNILSNREETVFKLADFGLGRAFAVPQQTYTNEVMTLYYRAPEVLLGERHYLPAVDMWSMGCVLAELARHRTMFAGEGAFTQLIAIFRELGTPDEVSWPGVTLLPHYNTQFPKWRRKDLQQLLPTLDRDGIDLLDGMFRYKPEERISAYEALQHPWFDEVRDDCLCTLQRQMLEQYY